MESILSALIAGAVTLIGVLIANSRSQAVTDTKLEELIREVREHNNFARRVPILEEQMKVANHRIADLENHERMKERNRFMELSNKISAATLARTAVLLLALTNQVLSAMGKPVLPIESTTVEQLVTAGITTVAALINWWKNNSFTAAAVAADSYMARLKQKQ